VTPRASPPVAASSAPKKCVVVQVAQPDGTLDFQEKCE
jgi:hypothetical protein